MPTSPYFQFAPCHIRRLNPPSAAASRRSMRQNARAAQADPLLPNSPTFRLSRFETLAPTERSRTSTWSLLGVSSAARSVCRASAVGVAYDSRRFLFGDSETLHVRRRGPLQAAHLPPATLRSSDNMGATPRALASRRGTVHSTTLFSTSAMARSRRTPRAARVCHIYTRGDAPTTHQSIAACREHRFCRPLPTASNSHRPRTPSITI